MITHCYLCGVRVFVVNGGNYFLMLIVVCVSVCDALSAGSVYVNVVGQKAIDNVSDDGISCCLCNEYMETDVVGR